MCLACNRPCRKCEGLAVDVDTLFGKARFNTEDIAPGQRRPLSSTILGA